MVEIKPTDLSGPGLESFSALRVLTVNSHQPYLHLLSGLPHQFWVIDRGLRGFPCPWDPRVRPLPAHFRCGSLAEAAVAAQKLPFDVALAHNVTDLLTLRNLCPRLVLLFHCSLEGRVVYEGSQLEPREFAAKVHTFLEKVPAEVVFITGLKARSWQPIQGRIIEPGIPLDAYDGYTGCLPAVLRVANLQKRRDTLLNHTLQEEILDGLPHSLLGHNPDVPGAETARSWELLKEAYRSHRCFLITNHPELEDGFNLAVLEGMATGSPVVTTTHRTSPIQSGRNGFVGESAQELRSQVQNLLADRALAQDLGEAARHTVAERFPYDQFLSHWNEVLSEAAGYPHGRGIRKLSEAKQRVETSPTPDRAHSPQTSSPGGLSPVQRPRLKVIPGGLGQP